MIFDGYSDRLHNQLEAVNNIYAKLIYEKLYDICPVEASYTKEHLRSAPESGWATITPMTPWGGEYQNMWLRADITVPEAARGRALCIIPHTNAVEILYFLDGKPKGIINSKNDFIGGMHSAQIITQNAEAEKRYHIDLECYGGHFDPLTQPYDLYGVDLEAARAGCCRRVYEGLELALRDDEVWHFVYDLKCVLQMARSLPDNHDLRGRAKNALERVFAAIKQYPEDYPREVWHKGIVEARRIMAPLFEKTTENTGFCGKVGIMGHSHMDSAWRWSKEETIRKCARTYSNVLHLMEQYPEYTFIQSSAQHLEWMRREYPDIFEGIKLRVKEGRYDPNGGVWVECDGNMPSGESMIRQFLKGQNYTKKHLDYRADTFWLADTFGYSAAIPQIMQGCGVKYFCTTKISWNEYHSFPLDLFYWRGIDGTKVLAHFHHLQLFPDLHTIRCEAGDVRRKEVYNGKLLPYGFGDGGGGPTPGMLEDARRVKGLPGLPEIEHTTAGRFMRDAEERGESIPVFADELYLEKHRGVLTQNHEIKRSNRKAEFALRDLEYFNVLSGEGALEETDGLYKTLLLNQAHDVISGTSLHEVMTEAIAGNNGIIKTADERIGGFARRLIRPDEASITLFNTLSFERDDVIRLCGIDGSLEGCICQGVEDIFGRKLLSVGGMRLPGFGARTFKITQGKTEAPSPFKYDGKHLSTPFAEVEFDDAGCISSFIVKENGRELCREGGEPLNTFYTGECVPREWDSYDLDYSMRYKLAPEKNLTSRRVVADGALEFRIRSEYSIGKNSALTQDMIFYAHSPRVDFHTRIDWHDKRTVLKAGFDMDIAASSIRNEIQFGYIERPTTENNSLEAVKFEVSNYKWSDISESRFGAALLNDCKYGISVRDTDVRLTLEQGGAHPDTTAGEGVHEMTYSILPHMGSMSVNNVTKPSYMLNIPPITVRGSLAKPMKPFIEISCDHVICEAIKPAEEVEGAVVMRFYEAEKCRCDSMITIPEGYTKAYLTNMLEEIQEELPISEGRVKLNFHPFQIHTIMLCK